MLERSLDLTYQDYTNYKLLHFKKSFSSHLLFFIRVHSLAYRGAWIDSKYHDVMISVLREKRATIVDLLYNERIRLAEFLDVSFFFMSYCHKEI